MMCSYKIGLNSSSSFDGVDAVLCSISLAQDDHPSKPTFITSLTVDWPETLQPLMLRAFSNELTIFEMTRLNYAAGALYAEAANALLEKAGVSHKDVDVVGYDGQTIYQEPPDRQKERVYVEGRNVGLVDKWLKGGYPCGFFIAESGVVAAPPRSAWRLDFGADYGDAILEKHSSSSTEDLLATLTLFTALSITRSLIDFVLPRGPITQVIASGGDTRNKTLMHNLGSELAKTDLKLIVSDGVGIPAAYKEAVKFARLAYANKRGEEVCLFGEDG